MKNFNILGVRGKTRVLEMGVHKKPIYREDSLKEEAKLQTILVKKTPF